MKQWVLTDRGSTVFESLDNLLGVEEGDIISSTKLMKLHRVLGIIHDHYGPISSEELVKELSMWGSSQFKVDGPYMDSLESRDYIAKVTRD